MKINLADLNFYITLTLHSYDKSKTKFKKKINLALPVCLVHSSGYVCMCIFFSSFFKGKIIIAKIYLLLKIYLVS